MVFPKHISDSFPVGFLPRGPPRCVNIFQNLFPFHQNYWPCFRVKDPMGEYSSGMWLDFWLGFGIALLWTSNILLEYTPMKVAASKAYVQLTRLQSLYDGDTRCKQGGGAEVFGPASQG